MKKLSFEYGQGLMEATLPESKKFSFLEKQ